MMILSSWSSLQAQLGDNSGGDIVIDTRDADGSESGYDDGSRIGDDTGS